MRSSLHEASAPLQDLPAVSAQGPSNPLGDRPRMAEALASLKEGLRDTADPLYDGWKLRPRPAAPANAQETAAESVSRTPPLANGDAIADAAETIDIALEGTPDETPTAEAEPETSSLTGALDEGFPTEEVLIEVTVDDAAPPPSVILRRASVQTDTVPVRIIRYPSFPRWALVIVAALLVFAGSLAALRARFPRESTRSSRSVLASQVAAAVPASNADRAAFPAANPPAATAPGVNALAPAGAPSPIPASAEPRPPAPGIEPGFAAPSPNDAPTSVVPATPPAGKLPSSSPRRRPGGHDFFRDPGF
jgi:hypothetical protein